VVAPCSQWIARSPVRNRIVAGRSTRSLGVKNMPGLAVSLNGTNLATVSTEGLNVVGVRVHGDVVGPEFAAVDLSGGLYGGEKESKHLIWIDQREIAAGDEIEVSLLEHADTSLPGKTIDELYSGDDSPMGPWQPLEEGMADLLKQPRVRERFTFVVIPPAGAAITASTQATDHSFGFSVLWNWMHPERVRVSLSSNSLQNIVKRTGGVDHANFLLQFGESVKLRVDA
jgi:hypothetical protein